MPAATLSAMGLSPRVRGNPPWLLRICRRAGSIPACAGEPRRRRRARSAQGVYPRVCGGTDLAKVVARHRRGLSPRVRGNLGLTVLAGLGVRSIPACAGEPYCTSFPYPPVGVYPRVCGGTVARTRTSYWVKGLSPRVRGNRARGCAARYRVRSIPACAGEPAPSLALHCQQRVYPRVCGGTHGQGPRPAGCDGLSPRVRGNRPGHAL